MKRPKIWVNGVLDYESRHKWRATYGEIPKNMVIDHIDGNTANNDLSNLRLASRSENAWNQQLSSANSSGVKGISWWSHGACWRAQLSANKEQVFCKYYKEDQLDLAIKELKEAREKYHKNFANNGKHKI
jgi:hypothetical protein